MFIFYEGHKMSYFKTEIKDEIHYLLIISFTHGA